jgi:hypothetical protein
MILFTYCLYATSVSQSKFGIFELLVEKETFADALLTGTVSIQFAKLAAGEQLCHCRTLIENYSTSKPLKVLLKNHKF